MARTPRKPHRLDAKPTPEPRSTPVSMFCSGILLSFPDAPDGADPAALPQTWNQIAVIGEFRGHGQGAFAFTSDVFDQIVANFHANPNRRIQVDYEHASETREGTVPQRGAPAVAWVTELDVRDGALWGRFDWVDPEAVAYVRTGRYRYLSPAVSFSFADPVTGEARGARLSSVALTNDPFLQGMEPLAASRAQADATRMGIDVESVHVPVPLGADPDNAVADPRPTPNLIPPETPAMDEAELTNLRECAAKYEASMKRMRAVGVRMGMDPEAAEDAIYEQIGKSLDDLGKIQDEEKKRMRAAAEEDVAEAVKASMIADTDEARGHALALRVANPEAFKAIVMSRPAANPRSALDVAILSTPLASRGGGAPGNPADGAAALPDPLDSEQVVAEADRLMTAATAAGKPYASKSDAYLAASKNLTDRRRTALLTAAARNAASARS